MRPKLPGVMFVFGMSRFSTLNRFENAISNRSREGGATVKLLPIVIENTFVPGPTSVPTAQLPKRPMFDAGRTKAALVNHASTVGLDRLASPTQSGRCVAVQPRTVEPGPVGTALV